MDGIMQSILKNMMYLISAIFIIYGIIDIAHQLQSGNSMEWGFLIIIFGIGMGPPLILYFNPDIFASDSDSSTDSDTMQNDTDES
jgi:uncharacterized membrane protein HdeD (DUF308 family)